jgi:hypothetical protein
MCGRLLVLPRIVILAASLVLVVVLSLGLWKSGKIKSKLYGKTSSADAYKAAIAFVGKDPAAVGVVKFSSLGETLVQRSDVWRWRVVGYVDMQPKPGVKIRMRYYCILQYNRARHWAVEDIRFEKVEQGPGQARQP